MHRFEDHIEQAAQRYVNGIENGGLQPSEKLVRAMIERAQQDYQKQIVEEHLENMETIMKAHNQRENEIKHESARLRLWVCPLALILFGLMAWYSFAKADALAGALYGTASLVFLALLVLGAIFDQPKS